MSSKLNRIYCVICFCIGLLSFCKAQAPYTVTVSVRDDNIVTLTCRGSDSIDILSPVFSLNSTQQDLKTQLVPGSYSERSTSLAFQITQRLEGNYFCGPDLSSISSESPLTLIAHPLNSPPRIIRATAVAGRDAVLPPLISPGALIQQYFIDWQDATSSVTLAYIQGPRSQRSIVTDERYSINPNTFELTISSVRFEDRGSYLGMIGVMDPEGEFFTYEQTRQYNITLDVYVPPTFLKYPQATSVVSSSSTTFCCKVQGYPQPTIAWNHDGRDATSKPDKYRIEQIVSTGPPFIVESNLTITALRSEDSGNVECGATVRTNEGEILEDQKISQLSFLGKLADLRTFVTVTQGVILRVYLVKPLASEVQLFVRYTNVESGEVRNHITPFSYNTQSKEIAFFDENVPFQKFKVEVALMSDSIMGSIYNDTTTHDLSNPTEFEVFASQTLPRSLGIGFGASVGALFVLSVIELVIIIAIIACLSRCLLRTLLKNTPIGPRSVILDEQLPYTNDFIKRLAERVEALEQQNKSGGQENVLAEEDTLGGSPSLPKWRKLLCCSRETEKERQARETYEEIEHLLQKESIRRVLEGSNSANGVAMRDSPC